MSTSQGPSKMKPLGDVVKLSGQSDQLPNEQTPSLPKVRQLESVTEYQDVEHALKSLMPGTVRASLTPKTDQYFTSLIGYEVTSPIPEDDRLRALDLLSESLQPCPKEVAVKAMYALKVRTANTPAERYIAEERMALYLTDLLAYPQDVVVAACRSIADESKWFPAWSDLKKELEWRVMPRRKAFKALNGL